MSKVGDIFFSQAARVAVLCCAWLSSGAVSAQAGELSELKVEQPITATGQVYKVAPGLKISFVLQAPENVTVEIRRHLAAYTQFKWPWLEQPYLVRTLALGQMAAGPQSVDWDGMDDKGKPITETHNLTPAQMERESQGQPPVKFTTSDQLTETVPVDRVQVVVKAGGEQLSVNFERGANILQPNRTAVPFVMGTPDKEGHYLVTDFIAWSVYRYTSHFVPEPDDSVPKSNGEGEGVLPAECRVVHLDSKGNYLIMDSPALWRFNAQGLGVAWPHQAPYTRPNANGIALGNPTTDPAKLSQPGFATSFSGFDIDDKDMIYIACQAPSPSVQVFDDDGNFVRRLALPAGKSTGGLAWVGNNTLAVAVGDSWQLMDATSGAVKKTVTDGPALFLQTDRERNIYAGPDPTDLRRYTSTGDPLPFNTALSNVKSNHLQLFIGDMAKTPSGSAGFAPNGLWGLAFAADGSFYASEKPGGDANALTRTNLLHYAKDGTFLPDKLLVKWGRNHLGNVYVDHEPATMDLLVTNFSDQKQLFNVNWTLTDFDGKKVTGTTSLVADPLARQVIPFTVNAPEFGHYYVEAEIRQGDNFVESLKGEMARIASRPLTEDRYSPFAVAWIGEAYLMALAGNKSTRGDYLNWDEQVEPRPGLFYPDCPEVPQYGRGGADSVRAYFRKWGCLTLNMLDYGEGWLGGQASPIYDFDRFYGYCQHMLDIFAPQHEAFYQTWNEPNFWWRYASPDPFAREQYTLLQQHVWSMVKAHDKDALSLGDGDAGSIEIMQQFSDFGAAGFSDTVEMHYPASNALAFNNMQVPDLPETKATAIGKLVDLRDKLFPGKEVWNTEENIPPNVTTPELAATNLPRVEIPQIAAGVDKIFQFSQTAVASMTLHDPTAFLDENGEPYPTYASYATMTRQIDGTVFCGKPDLGTAGTYGYLFAGGKNFVLVANDVAGKVDATIDAGEPSVTVVNIMGRSREASTNDGKLTLTLSPRVQYVLLPRSSEGGKAIAGDELKKELAALQLTSAGDIAGAATEALKTAATDLSAMNRLYHLVKAAEVAEAAGQAPGGGDASEARTARATVERKESADGYLRQARIALAWAEHLAQISRDDPSMAWPAQLAAQAAEALANTETPCYPGAAVSAYIGEPGQIEKFRAMVPVANKPETSIDNQFRFQIDRKPGDAFELELTVSDYYQHPLTGTVTPRLPDGWTASPASANYSAAPGKFQRFVFNVTIPAGAKPGVFSVGGETALNGATVPELHAMRIKLP